ncbi:MICOS complex subunit MIC27-like [Dreissena polymorpha]|uniref:MICOS complex subunit MIC27-like n=1 Tax=Dreissena polymorpha TaxID=45954 RepID=UPI00226527FA|nr:MICOS complex subunit MIC27-like [Dreissena polymorpha]
MPILTAGRVGAVTAVVVPSAVLYASYTQQVPTTGKMVKISELPIYQVPKPASVQLVPEEIGILRSGISSVRTAVWGWLDSQKETTDKIKEKMDIGKAHTEYTISKVKGDDGVNVPKISVVAASGLAGFLLGYRSSVVKKLGISTFAILTAAALCYPNETVDLTKEIFNEVKTSITGATGSSEKKDES